MNDLLSGRELLIEEIPFEMRKDMEKKRENFEQLETYDQKKGRFFCRRCQTEMVLTKAKECICGQPCAYCRNCLKMGKVRKCGYFYTQAEQNHFPMITSKLLAWEGELSEQQENASVAIQQTIATKGTRLLWAVAGAGKTEMLFPGIETALQHGERVCIASPRVDVCLELGPRVQAAFPTIPLAVLHGNMEKPYQYTQLVIATTHQLFRFKAAFDLLIIDEIDAFPFEMDQALQFAAEKARKKESALIYLSATPNRQMQKQVKQGKLPATILPARYHGYKLPVPQTKWCAKWPENLLTKFQKTSFGKDFQQRIQSEQRFLVFVPNIEWMATFEKNLRKLYPTVPFESVSSEDAQRKEKVMHMREGKVQFLITTTILERGVTFPNIDVLVVGAEDRIYTEAALVQIAGRCGRSADYPTGTVIYYHDGKTLSIKRAIKQIKKMNRLAKEKGLVR